MISKKTQISSMKFIISICFLIFFPLMSQADVTLTIGRGSAFPGSTDCPVEVSLENQNDLVGGIQMDICDVGNFLTPVLNDNPPPEYAGCELTDRTAGFGCMVNELSNGCCRVLLFSTVGTPIEEGEGPVFTLMYDASVGAPSEECRNLNPEGMVVSDEYGASLEVDSVAGSFCFPCTSDANCDDGLYCNGEESCEGGLCQAGTDSCTEPLLCDERNDLCVESCVDNSDCDDGLYCNGEETCLSRYCQPGTNPCPGESCREEGGCYTPTTTTTTSPPPPPPPPPSCDVSVSPSSADVGSGGTLQFTALTMCDGQEVEGEYLWEIEPESTIGSTVDEDGLFAAGDNTTDFEIEETVKVTDTAHDNKSDTAIVTIDVKEKPIPECEVTVSPSSATVSSGEMVSLVAETAGEGCLAGDYEWSIDSEIESVVDQEGNYTAGINTTGAPATDVITVVDSANSDTSTTVMITVESNIVSVLPARLMGSRWVPLFYFLLITTEDISGFDPSSTSTVSFEPADDVLPLGHSVFGNVMLAMVILSANPQEGTVDVIVDTGGEIATGKLTIQLLPFTFAEDSLGNSEPGKEIPL